MPETKKTFCSICSAFCGFDATVESNRIIDFSPDPEHPMSQGFSCTKGRQFPHMLASENRLLQPLKLGPSGQSTISRDKALDEIADKINAIRKQHGPESIAVFCGNGVQFKGLTIPTLRAWMQGIGSHNFFSTMTIDQPAKVIAVGRHGVWGARGHAFDTADVALMIGNNTVVSSLNGNGGPPGWRPGAIKQARKRGLKLIVVDPRKTETAQLSDLHLAIRPGEDAVLLAGMIRLIIQEALYDQEFCSSFTAGLDELKVAVEPFTPDFVSERTELTVDDIKAATYMFAKADRGYCTSGTGPDMGPHPNLSEHLISCLNTICGRHNRAGDKISASLLTPDVPPIAGVIPKDFLPPTLNPNANQRRSRVADAGQVYQEMPSTTLPDEILTPGEGQVRALIVVGGNPMLSLPDRDKVGRAFSELELMVAIDVRQTDTTQLADYVLPATYGLERAEMTSYGDFLYDKPFHQFADKLVDGPEQATEEWVYLAELAQRMGTSIPLPGGDLDYPAASADIGNLFEKLFPDDQIKVPVRDIMSHEGGHIFKEYEAVEVVPAFEGMDDRLQFMPAGIEAEIEDLYHDDWRGKSMGKDLLLICRRNRYVYNSMCHEVPQTAKSNPAYMHADELAARGLTESDEVSVATEFGECKAYVAVDNHLRRGVVSLSHNFGDRSNHQHEPEFPGTHKLFSLDNSNDPYARMPILSAVPVSVVAARERSN